jgi:anti-sigma factor RsiW
MSLLLSSFDGGLVAGGARLLRWLAVARELTCREMVKLVSDYLEHRLPADAARRFEAHLAVCDGCQAYVEQVRQTIDALGELPEERLSAGARDTLMAAFRNWHAEGA